MESLQAKIGKIKKRVFAVPALLLLMTVVPCPASANVSVSLKLDRSEITVSDTVRMVVSVSGARSTDSEPIVSGLQEFIIRPGGTSSRFEIVNGMVNAGIEHTFLIRPQKTGKFHIGPAEVGVKGKSVRSNTVMLTVVKQTEFSAGDGDPLFLNASLSSRRAYVEEQIIYTLRLYRLNKVSDISLDLPEVEYLTFKQLGKPIEYQNARNGKTYQVLEIRYAVVPSRKGNYTIKPAKMNMTVYQPRRRSRRSLFEDPFFSFSTGKSATLASQPLELTVLMLPDKGKPTDFSGLVGEFKIESTLAPSSIHVGESATLTVLLSGKGNVKRIPDLEVPELDYTKVYADQPVLQVEPTDKGFTATKTMKWAFVPEREGRYGIPPLSVSFFDTKSGQYRVIRTPSLSLSVLAGKEEVQMQASGHTPRRQSAERTAKQAVKEIGRDILPAHTSIKDLTSGLRVQPGSLVFWLVILAPPFAYALSFCGMRFKSKSEKALAATRAKKAAKTLMKLCRQGELSSSHLGTAIRDYLNNRFGLTLGTVTPSEGEEILQSRGASRDTAQKLKALLQRLEDAVYAGKGHESCDVGKDIPRIIRQIEKEIR